MGNIEGIDSLLEQHPFFAGMAVAQREYLAGCASNMRFDAGEFVLREGGDADAFYMIRHGTVAIELHAPGRDSIILQTLHDGDVLGSSWIVPPYKWSFDARAVQLTRLVSLDAVCLRGKCEEDPVMGFDLMKRFVPVLAERLHAAQLQLIDMYGSSRDA